MHDSEVAIAYFLEGLFNDSSRDVQVLRKVMIGELFIIFVAYVANLLRNHYLNPAPSYSSQPGRSDDARNKGQGLQKKPFLSNIPYLEERFAIYFMHHTIALAFAIVWAPYEFEIVITYIHLGFFFGYVISEIKEIPTTKNICYVFMTIINLLLILAALVNIGSWKV